MLPQKGNQLASAIKNPQSILGHLSGTNHGKTLNNLWVKHQTNIEQIMGKIIEKYEKISWIVRTFGKHYCPTNHGEAPRD